MTGTEANLFDSLGGRAQNIHLADDQGESIVI
jgi:hypothetical protein